MQVLDLKMPRLHRPNEFRTNRKHPKDEENISFSIKSPQHHDAIILYRNTFDQDSSLSIEVKSLSDTTLRKYENDIFSGFFGHDWCRNNFFHRGDDLSDN